MPLRRCHWPSDPALPWCGKVAHDHAAMPIGPYSRGSCAPLGDPRRSGASQSRSASGGPILTEVHPRKIGILSVIVNNPESSKFPRPFKNGRRRAIFRGRRAASRHAPTWKCSREGARHDPKAPVSLMHRGAVPVRTGPSQVIRVPSWPRGEPPYSPRLKRAHQVETH